MPDQILYTGLKKTYPPKRKRYPDGNNKGKLTLIGINPKTGQRLYSGFLQLYITKL